MLPAGSSRGKVAHGSNLSDNFGGFRVKSQWQSTADDNNVNRRILTALLEVLGLTPVVVEDGVEAVSMFQQQQFDLILLDISMPNMNGVDALKEMQKLASENGAGLPPVIAVTAHSMRHQIDEFLNAGFSGHIPKPFKRDEIQRVITSCVARVPTPQDRVPR